MLKPTRGERFHRDATPRTMAQTCGEIHAAAAAAPRCYPTSAPSGRRRCGRRQASSTCAGTSARAGWRMRCAAPSARGQSRWNQAGWAVPVHRAARRRPARGRTASRRPAVRGSATPARNGGVPDCMGCCDRCCRSGCSASIRIIYVESGVDARVRVCQLAADVRVRPVLLRTGAQRPASGSSGCHPRWGRESCPSAPLMPVCGACSSTAAATAAALRLSTTVQVLPRVQRGAAVGFGERVQHRCHEQEVRWYRVALYLLVLGLRAAAGATLTCTPSCRPIAAAACRYVENCSDCLKYNRGMAPYVSRTEAGMGFGHNGRLVHRFSLGDSAVSDA